MPFSLPGPGASAAPRCATPDCSTPLGCRWSWRERADRPHYCASCWDRWGTLAGTVLSQLLPGESPVDLPLGNLVVETPGQGQDAPRPVGGEARKTTIEVTPEDTLHAAKRVKDLEPTSETVVVLNMANAEHIGGAFLRDVAGQEEELCRRTAIYPRLANNQDRGIYPLPEVSVVLDHQVQVLRSDKESGYTPLPEAETFPITVATGAAPIRPWTETPEQLEAYRNLMGRKIFTLLAACEAGGYKKLVLSAWGCGAFRNPPKEVAQLFKTALETRFSGSFDHVVFAIADRPGWGETNYDVFLKVFSSESDAMAADDQPQS